MKRSFFFFFKRVAFLKDYSLEPVLKNFAHCFYVKERKHNKSFFPVMRQHRLNWAFYIYSYNFSAHCGITG